MGRKFISSVFENVLPFKPKPNPLPYLPTEMWVMIFSYHHSPINPRESAKSRRVCTEWCNIIDGSLDFQITLDDERMDLTTLKHLRVKQCTIRRLMTDTFPNSPSIFQYPYLLQELCVWGPITPRNFQALMKTFEKVKKLSLNDKCLLHPDLIRLDPHDNVNNYWKDLKSLNVTVSKPISPECIASIFGLPVSGLVNFTFIGCNLTSISDTSNVPALLLFVSRMVNLKTLHLKYYRPLPEEHPLDPQTLNPVVSIIEGIQLDSVTLSLCSKGLRDWMPFLRTQNKLRLINMIDNTALWHYNLYAINELGNTLTRNYNTLRCVELGDIRLSQPLDCLIFEPLKQLKRLFLRRFPVSFDPQAPIVQPPHIENLGWLPHSLEDIALVWLSCYTKDLKIMADRMVNIKRMELKNVGIRGAEWADNLFGVNQQVLQKIARKRSCQYVAIDPVPTDRFDILVNDTRRYVVVNEMSIDVLQRSFSGSSYIQFDFRNARNQL